MSGVKKALIATDVAVGAGAQAGGASPIRVPAGTGKAASAGTAYDGTEFAPDVDKRTPSHTPSLSLSRINGSVIARNLYLLGERGMVDLKATIGYRPGTNAGALDLSLEPSARYFLTSTAQGPINLKASIFAGAQHVSGQLTNGAETKDFSGWLGQVGAGVGAEILFKNKFPIGVQIGVQKNFGGDLGNGASGVSGTSLVASFDLGALIFDSGKPSWSIPDADAGDPTACEREAVKLGPTPKAVKEALEKCIPGTAGCSPEPVVKAAAHNLDGGNPNDIDTYNSRLIALATALGNPKYVASDHGDAADLMDKLGAGLDEAIKKDASNAYELMIDNLAPLIMPLASVDLANTKKLEGLYSKVIAGVNTLQPKHKIAVRVATLTKFYASTLNRAVAADIQATFRPKADALMKETLVLLKANPEFAKDTLLQLAAANKAVKGKKASRGKAAIPANKGSTLLAAHKADLLASAKLIKSAGIRNKVILALKQAMKTKA